MKAFITSLVCWLRGRHKYQAKRLSEYGYDVSGTRYQCARCPHQYEIWS